MGGSFEAFEEEREETWSVQGEEQRGPCHCEQEASRRAHLLLPFSTSPCDVSCPGASWRQHHGLLCLSTVGGISLQQNLLPENRRRACSAGWRAGGHVEGSCKSHDCSSHHSKLWQACLKFMVIYTHSHVCTPHTHIPHTLPQSMLMTWSRCRNNRQGVRGSG